MRTAQAATVSSERLRLFFYRPILQDDPCWMLDLHRLTITYFVALFIFHPESKGITLVHISLYFEFRSHFLFISCSYQHLAIAMEMCRANLRVKEGTSHCLVQQNFLHGAKIARCGMVRGTRASNR
jgi:hypothetical protein